MGPRLHGSARTTAAVRRALPQRPESLATLATRDALHPNTVAKWQKLTQGHDAPMGPKPPRSTVLTVEAAALIGACRKHTVVPLDDGLSALPATRPHVPRSALHRCLHRHGLSRLPALGSEKPAKKQFKASAIGDCQLAIAAVRTEAGTRSLVVALDRTGTLADAARHEEAHTMVAAPCRRNVMAAVPEKIHTGLTDHGMQCTNRQRDV